MILGCEINISNQQYYSLYSDPHVHSPICICQSGQVMFPLSAIMLNSTTWYWSEQSTCSHIEGARSDRVAVTYIRVPQAATPDVHVRDSMFLQMRTSNTRQTLWRERFCRNGQYITPCVPWILLSCLDRTNGMTKSLQQTTEQRDTHSPCHNTWGTLFCCIYRSLC